jgi:hypothetical protein
MDSTFKNTIISRSKIISIFHSNGNDKIFNKISEKLKQIKFEGDNYYTTNVKSLLALKEKNNNTKKEKTSEKIFKILKNFKKNPKKSYRKEIFKRYDKNILNYLLHEEIIIEVVETTTEKRKEKRFKLNQKHQFYKSILETLNTYNSPTKVIAKLAEEYLNLK